MNDSNKKNKERILIISLLLFLAIIIYIGLKPKTAEYTVDNKDITVSASLKFINLHADIEVSQNGEIIKQDHVKMSETGAFEKKLIERKYRYSRQPSYTPVLDNILEYYLENYPLLN